MRTDLTRPGSARHSGVAAVEFMLVLPFLLILAVLAFINTRLMFLNQHNEVAARTAAWERAHYQQPCPRAAREAFGGSYGQLRLPCQRDTTAADDFRSRYGRNSDQRRFQAIIRGDGGVPAGYLASARARYSPAPAANLYMNGRLSAELNASHALDADPVRWSLQRLPIGYDSHLDEELSSFLFDRPPFFPNAR